MRAKEPVRNMIRVQASRNQTLGLEANFRQVIFAYDGTVMNPSDDPSSSILQDLFTLFRSYFRAHFTARFE
jgi:hypothetical protein